MLISQHSGIHLFSVFLIAKQLCILFLSVQVLAIKKIVLFKNVFKNKILKVKTF